LSIEGKYDRNDSVIYVTRRWEGDMNPERKIRIMVAKPGLNGHDRGAKIIARGFRDAGFEVIYTGLHQTPEQIVAAAIQEDVDAIGLSSLAGAHDYLFPRVVKLLNEKGADDIVVFGGGIIPEEDIAELKTAGIREIFTPGTPIEEAVNWVRQNIKPKK
jgi:methylmalonyl-CoA mutase C-terminal domain/subunit